MLTIIKQIAIYLCIYLKHKKIFEIDIAFDFCCAILKKQLLFNDVCHRLSMKVSYII